jgi:lipopolysaccharide transport system permease protein
LGGLILWNLFSSAVSHGSESIIQQEKIISKMYFPRLIIPCSSVLVALFDFLMGFAIFIIFCFIYKQPVHWNAVIYFPVAIIIVFKAAFGFSTFLSALTVKYRYTIPFMLQVMFFSSQVIYPLQSIQQSWLKYLLAINPVNAAIELFRAPLSSIYIVDWTVVGIGTASTVCIVLLGLFFFKKTEAYFADLT